MAETTGIGWTDATFNPWVGCEKVSPGCAHCYAEELVTGRMGRAGTWGADGVRERTAESTWAKPRAYERYAQAGILPDGKTSSGGRRPRIFCASLADVFEPRPELDPWRRDLFDLIAATPSLDWQLLTKRPEFARDWLRAWYEADGALDSTLFGGAHRWTSRVGFDWGVPPNVWIGASIENARFTWRADILREIPAAVRFISAEPLLGSLFPGPTSGESPDAADALRQPDEGSIPSGSILDAGRGGGAAGGSAPGRTPGQSSVEAQVPNPPRRALDLTGIDWVIVGGESGGRDARPMHPDWAREIRDAIMEREDFEFIALPGRVTVLRSRLYFKQWGSWVPWESAFRSPVDHVFPDGQSMIWLGSSPKAGGKLLDGVEWCEFPENEMVPA